MKAVHSKQVAEEDFARVLIVGQMKIGKTTALVSTAPKPLLLNCDGVGASHYAAVEQDADFLQLDIGSVKAWNEGVKEAVRMAKDGECDSIIVDSATLLADEIVGHYRKAGKAGFELWGEVGIELQAGFRALMKAPAHIFIVAHIDPLKDPDAGVLPLIAGQTKVWLPARVSDWVLFDFDERRTPNPRAFLCGAQDGWPRSGRRATRAVTISPPDVGELLAELGF